MKSTIISSLALLTTAASAISLPNSNFGWKRPCSQAEVALATGIHLNIQGQYSEYNGTLKTEQVEQAHPSGPTPDFYLAKGMLQSDIQEGMNLRLFNQQIAPPGNPAIPGLAQYETAQQTEKNQVNGLTGTYATDKPTFDMLKTEIMNGIQLNENNLKAAVSECDFTLKFPPANEQALG
ncbi:hypothetical protein M409DRAFT_27794 [Zasmidium cellare ATCC 36951]|uniref:Uncharacterized protein n=1 Tax=Zasmidium cellare ATCC 36951 TaxID=1080233 RepID=A0A6A6C3M0_ZASCE|nr:uncharacterized protein M409DRAFT_27794 [Zasmidium cellare ATCC 36951]KAF2161737.1 hypothetical protein M409DRAFT_27794 [Zasmidium cellare ATCC 36951]